MQAVAIVSILSTTRPEGVHRSRPRIEHSTLNRVYAGNRVRSSVEYIIQGLGEHGGINNLPVKLAVYQAIRLLCAQRIKNISDIYAGS